MNLFSRWRIERGTMHPGKYPAAPCGHEIRNQTDSLTMTETETPYPPDTRTGHTAPAHRQERERHTIPSKPLDRNPPPPKASRLDRDLVEALISICLFCDCLVVLLACIWGLWICLNTGLVPTEELPSGGLVACAGPLIVTTFLLLLSLSLLRIYNGTLLLAPRQIVTRIAQAGVGWLGGILSATAVFHSHPQLLHLSSVLGVACASALALLVTWRSAFHHWLAHSPLRARLRHRILFVGWNDDAKYLVGAFRAQRPPGYHAAGCVLRDDPAGATPDPLPIPTLGRIADLPRILREEAMDIVIVADGNLPPDEVARMEKLCEETMVQFHLVVACLRALVYGTSVDVIGGIPVLGISRLPLDRIYNELIKRAVDIAGAVVGLILGAPLIVLFGLWVYLESPGPIFYRQRRLGWNGRPFQIIKIRSMRLDAEKNGIGWTTRNDPRRLAIGAFLRKWNIDELPQFWNVLKGDMSLVGPRAERPELIRVFHKDIPHYNVRHSIRPGMSGWAQVNGYRGDTDLTERVRYDLFYIEHWSLLFDFKIMVRTFLVCGGS